MDRRSSSPEVLGELRERAVKLKKEGMTHREIARVLGIRESTSRLYWRLYREGGREGLALKRRGRQPGTRRRLSRRQEAAIQRLVADRTPDQLKMPFALWTRRAVGELIRRRYGVELPVRTLGEYLRRWGYTPQKPRRREAGQEPEAVRRWLAEEYPAVAARARREGAVIYWADETGIGNQEVVGRSYAPRGRGAVRTARARKVSVSMISAVNNRGQMRFMVYRRGMTAGLFVEFLRRLVKGMERKVILIVDNLRVHKAVRVRRWLRGREDQIELVYLPPYSPELNPDEYLNHTLKEQLGRRPPAGTMREQEQRVRQQMHSNQRRPQLIRSLFESPTVRYAA